MICNEDAPVLVHIIMENLIQRKQAQKLYILKITRQVLVQENCYTTPRSVDLSSILFPRFCYPQSLLWEAK